MRDRTAVKATRMIPFKARGKMHGTAIASSSQASEMHGLSGSSFLILVIGSGNVTSSIPSMKRNGDA